VAQAITQTCVINLLRNSFRYASKRDWAAIAKDLKLVYTAASESAVLDAFVAFSETWGERYPAIIKLWENAWAEFVPFLAFDKEIRSDLYDQQHRKPELEDPQGGERPRPLPDRAGRAQVRLPGDHEHRSDRQGPQALGQPMESTAQRLRTRLPQTTHHEPKLTVRQRVTPLA
jgi:hypothetical protein